MSFQRLLYAHRGASSERPENTLEAFARAIELGANALELDVRLTKDGRVVAAHDEDLQRVAKLPTKIGETVYQELKKIDLGQGARLTTLDEVVSTFPVPLNVDLKDVSPRLVRAVVAIVRAAGAASRVRLASFDRANLETVRSLQYEGPVGMDPSEVRRFVLTPALLAAKLRPRGTALQIPVRYGLLRLDRKSLIHRAHALGIRVDYWVVNDLDEARRLLALGADGLVTDRPELLAPLFKGP